MHLIPVTDRLSVLKMFGKKTPALYTLLYVATCSKYMLELYSNTIASTFLNVGIKVQCISYNG